MKKLRFVLLALVLVFTMFLGGCTLFAFLWDIYGNWVNPANDGHNGQPPAKVVVSEAQFLETAVNGVRPELRIRVNLNQTGKNWVDELERLLVAYPGENPLAFELIRPGDFWVVLRPRRLRGVQAAPDLLDRLRELCGEEAVLSEPVRPLNGNGI